MSLRHRLAGPSDDGDSKNEGGKVRLMLASQSPRRREILAMMGLEGRFDVVPSPVDERAVQEQLQQEGPVAPPQYAERLARAKALALAEQLRSNQHRNEAEDRSAKPTSAAAASVAAVVVLGSDTIVELDGRILEKPSDESDAKEMLSRLSGRMHLVHTGVALACVKGGWSNDALSSSSFVDTAAVQFVTLSPEDIDAYVSTGEPMDKAGSYGIQGIGGQMVESITGDFFTVRSCFGPEITPSAPTICPTAAHRHVSSSRVRRRQVMGLPMCRVSQELARLIEELQEPL